MEIAGVRRGFGGKAPNILGMDINEDYVEANGWRGLKSFTYSESRH
jgi:hypothetical protein